MAAGQGGAGRKLAPGPAGIALYRNATEAVNAVMYSLLTEFRDGDNVVTTLMEHNSNYVPWYAMCREILPRFGRRVQCRLARFDPVSGELDLEYLASLIDARTKLICCTGASNFLGTRNPLAAVRALADASGYYQPNGERRSWLLIDGAQLVPGSFTDVHALGADYLAFSFHKLLAPFGVGVLYAREQLLTPALPFLYGGDMIAEGRVFPNHVEYNALPWKYSAGTPNILGAVVSAQALRLLLDLALTPKRPVYFGTARPVGRDVVRAAMTRVAGWNQMLTSQALDGLGAIDGITIYGPRDAARRTSLVAFNLAGRDPVGVARALNQAGIESRAGCHCATLAHHALGLNPPASCRLSFYLYNTPGEVDRAVQAVAAIAAGRGVSGSRFRSWPAVRANDIELNYKLEGDGEDTIVLINGLADDLETWVLQMDDFLAPGYRVLRFDNRGIGASSKPAGPYTSRMLADDAKALADSLGITGFHLMGVSMGGMIAQEYALAYPGDLRSVTFACTYAAPGPFCSRMFAMWGDMAPVLGVPFVMRDVTLWAFTVPFFEQRESELAEFETAMRYMDQPVHAYLAQLAVIQGHDTVSRLGEITTPALVMAGEEDILIPVSLSRRIHEGIPGSEWATTKGGHGCVWEHPAEFNQTYLDFTGRHRKG